MRHSTFAVMAALFVCLSMNATAQRRGGGGGGARVNRGAASTSIRSSNTVNANVNRNLDVNRNVNVNRDVDRDVNINRNIDVDADYDRWGHPIARGVTAGVAAGVAMGATVAMLPSGCSTVVVSGIGYSHCGSTWYQPYYSGDTVQYVVIPAPQ